MKIAPKKSLNGGISNKQTLSIKLSGSSELSGVVNIGGEFMPDPDWYEGAYEITPKITSQTLPTKEQTMKEDIVIKSIPYAEVTNLANGKTVTIGDE